MNDGEMAHNMLIESIFLSDRHKKGVKPLFLLQSILLQIYNNNNELLTI